MMYQGLFGAFPFTVTGAEVCTFRDLKVSHEQTLAEHATLAGLPRLQRTGRALANMTLSVTIAPLGSLSGVGARLRLLDALTREGRAWPLVIGLRWYGQFILASWEEEHRQLHCGVTLFAQVALSLKEVH